MDVIVSLRVIFIPRILYVFIANQSIENKPVILLQHGILMSSSAWVSESPKHSAGNTFKHIIKNRSI
jgi:hypothetical protein